MAPTLIRELLIILAAGLIAGLVCRWIKVSVLIGYLVVGTLLGDGCLGWVVDANHQLEAFAETGVFLLLFSIGLEFSLDDLRTLGRKLLIGGTVQMLMVAVPVACLLLQLGLSWRPAWLLASATAFSSTVLVFKALSECGQASQPHGRRAIGILLFQDAALVPLLLIVPLLTGESDSVTVGSYLALAGISSLFVLAVIGLRYALAMWIIPLFAGYRSPELVILFTLVVLGSVTLAAYTVGLPAAVGAFAAGLSFNGNRWTKQIDALVFPFRETFAAVFFVGLGLIFDPRLLISEPVLILGFLTGLILIKGLAATVALRLTSLNLQSSFGMGIGLAHVGEFAFILASQGVDAGLLSAMNYQRMVAISVGSLILTPLLLKQGLRWTYSTQDRNSGPPRTMEAATRKSQATIIGAGPIGRQVASQLELTGLDVCLVDLSSINLHPFAQEGFRTVVGDATEQSVLELAKIGTAAIIVVSVPNDDIANQIVRIARKSNALATILVRCRFQSNTQKLRSAGADSVVSEEAEASQALLRILIKH
ncbi:cation:proton antiporter domain-containing protein [Aureliella helgolandensis]|uniref:Inner membrane protein YbaL n=1 Tax=Aureliella helgolandensis TaxID=2527968 RepID=A0A518G1D3_9BACT|nr:cation:proton antiporter [Aureliella helgolandensis]QDV22393.1 Inner membrane protein YbaL [Aureliella helgolandensis]